ncbi:hypothetical protein SAMN02745885_02356 [Carboxydocella sporoproducens DSM 16521]|uniref:Polymerase/histidinol phosphatase N-terminal domain-containing protein n=2 Tax=Carboxydocella TaxID=178898 RepID=A0A1T4RZK6_9FIRM|nr:MULTISPECIES: PHP domain-containing protein [Carboxydocella]AVX20236.1 hypothetical protein CFE_1041 [Carboxydocella thermautotrophica]AVX30653.1 hypothetical protein CTH_1056 [Carboxydocella thermautotrophica]SKA21385.1 hypothetical protein SAMN02745885_02356 [Carboxydocella sporoproducens DSM 16521]
MIDLHTHTTASDGTFRPAELVELAYKQGLAALAITDHDVVDGLAEGIARGRELGLPVISGVEISVEWQGREMHILGYYIDHQHPQLLQNLAQLREFRAQRNPKMVEKLQALGIEITMAEVEAKAQGQVVGRPHFAAVLLEKGVVSSVNEAFDKYLARGGLAYVPKERLTPREGITLIRQAGGVPVLAHPRYLGLAQSQLVDLARELRDYGLAGIEVYYSENSEADTAQARAVAEELGLVMTGGTDFHGTNKPEIQLGRGHGNLSIPYSLVEELEKAWKRLTS